jgi:hypothetical protein
MSITLRFPAAPAIGAWFRVLVLLAAAASYHCAGGAGVERTIPSANSAREVTALEDAASRVDLTPGPGGGARVAIVTGGMLAVWQSPSLVSWTRVATEPSGSDVALAPDGAPILYAFAGPRGVGAAAADGTPIDLGVTLEPAESVTDLLAATEGVITLVELKRGARPARVRVLFSAFRGRSVAAPVEALTFEAGPGQSAMAVCSGAGRALLVTGGTRLDEAQQRIVKVTTLDALTFDAAAGAWSGARRIFAGSDESEFGREAALSPQTLSVRCDGITADVLVRSGAGWILRSSAPETWTAPRRILKYSAGYGAVGRTAAFCGDRIVWIDDRLERGTSPKPWNPTGGLPWSDDYPGWRISSVFASRIDPLLSDTAPPLLLSSDLGRARSVAASASGGACLVAWAGVRRVDKAGGEPEQRAPRLFMTTVEAGR